jgi:ANTAR domain/PAS fold
MTSPVLPRDRLTTRSARSCGDPVPRAGAPAAVLRVAGRYRHDLPDGAWHWSPEMFALHGLQPGDVEPSLELLLQHQHAEDVQRVVTAFTAACCGARAFTLQTRLVRADGVQRAAVLMGEPDLDPAGAVQAVEGVCLDITDSRPPGPDADRVRALETEVIQLRAAMASRATIEQAKGILMLLTNCGDQAAFELLAHLSSHTHRKVRDVAATITESAAGRTRLPADMRAIIRDACPPEPPSR